MKPPVPTHTGEVIRRWRVDADMRQHQLARLVNFAPSHLCQIESGKTGVRLSVAVALCRALGRSVDELVQEAGL